MSRRYYEYGAHTEFCLGDLMTCLQMFILHYLPQASTVDRWSIQPAFMLEVEQDGKPQAGVKPGLYTLVKMIRLVLHECKISSFFFASVLWIQM